MSSFDTPTACSAGQWRQITFWRLAFLCLFSDVIFYNRPVTGPPCGRCRFFVSPRCCLRSVEVLDSDLLSARLSLGGCFEILEFDDCTGTRAGGERFYRGHPWSAVMSLGEKMVFGVCLSRERRGPLCPPRDLSIWSLCCAMVVLPTFTACVARPLVTRR